MESNKESQQHTLTGEPIDINTVPICEVMVLPARADHPDLGLIRLVDYIRPNDYERGIYAYEDPKTDRYGGVILEDLTEVRVIRRDTS